MYRHYDMKPIFIVNYFMKSNYNLKGFPNAQIICPSCQSDWLIQLDLSVLTDQTDSLRK